MKKLLSLFSLLMVLLSAQAQQHSLVKIWETDTVLKVPESVLPDYKNKVLYVSNIDGLDPWGKDNKGSIAKVGMDGKIIAVDWVKGLNCPKGMGMYRGLLYVADLNEIAVIDIEKAELKRRIPVPYAERLNDITIDPRGNIYVSDSKGNRVYVVKGNDATPYLENLQGPNGVYWYRDNLYLLDKGTLYKVEYDRKLTKLSEGIEGGADGLDVANPKEFIASGWAGIIYYIYPDGFKETLLDTRGEKMNTADLVFDPVSRIIYVPTFWKNKVVAYELK